MRVLIVIIAALFIFGCAEAKKKDAGAIMGMVLGGVVGAVLGNNSDAGSKLGSVIGAGVGGLFGALIGEKLDEADRVLAEAATVSALSVPTGDRVEWQSTKNTSVHGFSKPTSGYESKGDQTCRTVRQVVVINGKEEGVTTEFCKIGDTGRWVAS
tara:strand:- start:185 stop:649 length:465 start_codon:yes stop_codon:yes gene_type:complete